MISQRLRRQLELVDWDFSEHLPGTTKSIHWYPGTYPSDIPATLIQALSDKSDIVFDPYGGVGTTALEALREGRSAWITEINPIGALVSYVAGGMIVLKSVDPDLTALYFDYLRRLLYKSGGVAEAGDLLENDDSVCVQIEKILEVSLDPHPSEFLKKYQGRMRVGDLSKWIERGTLQALRKLLVFGRSSQSSFTTLTFIVMASAICRACSSQTKSWGHIADNVLPKDMVPKDVFSLADRWLGRFEGMIRRADVKRMQFASSVEPRLYLNLHDWSSEFNPRDKNLLKTSVLITSPPYAGAIDYTLAQRISLYLLGYADGAIQKLCKSEIGARRKRFISTSRDQWAEELVQALTKQLAYVADSGFAAFVLPHKDAGRDLGTVALTALMEGLGWERVLVSDRSIRQGRARQSWTSIKQETIHIFAR